MEFWNNKELTAPPVNTYKARRNAIDLRLLSSILQNAMQILTNQQQLHFEAALLSRMTYRNKQKFRSDKGMKGVQKINKALSNYLQLNIKSVFSTFLSMLPNERNRELYLPTKQMLQFVLVRIQSFAKIMCRVVEASVITVQYMHARLRLGHLWMVGLLFTGAISRVWCVCKFLTQQSCMWYNQLKPFEESLKLIGVPWLPEEYSLPSDLFDWLNVDWIHEVIDLDMIQEKPREIFDLLDDSVIILNDSDDDSVQISFDKVPGIIGESDEDVEFLNVFNQNTETMNNISSDNEDVEIVDVSKLASTSKDVISVFNQNTETMNNISSDNEDVEIVDVSKLAGTSKGVISLSDKESDVGEVIDRASVLPKVVEQKRKKVKRKPVDTRVKRVLKCMKTSEDVLQFLNREDKLQRASNSLRKRKRTLNKFNVTKWNALKKKVMGFMKKRNLRIEERISLVKNVIHSYVIN